MKTHYTHTHTHTHTHNIYINRLYYVHYKMKNSIQNIIALIIQQQKRDTDAIIIEIQYTIQYNKIQ